MTDRTQDAGRLQGTPPAGRYTLDITEDKQGENPITISLDIEGSSVIRISARDEKGNVYEGGFHLRRAQRVKPPRPNPGSAHGGDEDEDEGEDDENECQVCTVMNGRTVCRIVPC